MPDRSRTRRGHPASLVPFCGLLAAMVGLSPEAQAYSTYYANLHSHCILSDGIGTPDEAFTHARDVANIDVLALTDHTHLLTSTEFNTLLTKAQQYTQDGVFVALGCQEFGILNDFGHINIFDAAFRNPNPTEDLTGCYSFILSQGAFGSFNHPNPSYGSFFNNLTYYPQYADAMRAIEVVNGLANGDYQTQWIQALNNGWKLGPFANQDNHQGNWGDQENTDNGGDIYLTGILADGLTKNDILGALRARRFFAMEIDPPNDRMELEFSCSGQPMGSEITTGTGPTFTVTARAINGTTLFNRIEIWRDGVLFHTKVMIGNQITYNWQDFLSDGESHYYFAKVQQVDQDRAWSAPIWVTAEVAPTDAPEQAVRREEFTLLPSYPNPALPSVELRFLLPHRSGDEPYRLSLTVHDVNGRLVRDLGSRLLSGGQHTWTWDGNDDQGRSVASGVYLYRVHGEGLPERSARVVVLN
ncbi:MAG: CehA/McbA family metallohydrolase [Candidatus Eisenbacteria bacterium]|nr:CehA/McbA family metallohydrolase [Candidatus Eisenbacteria bacterium]MCC7141189.1 CehA/McbA family metallohydrolase [Candidatus Eisenbacteria bacterium]